MNSFKLLLLIDKLPLLCKYFKNTQRNKMKEFSLESLITQLRIEDEAHKHDQKEEVNSVPKKNLIIVLKPSLKLEGKKMKAQTRGPSNKKNSQKP